MVLEKTGDFIAKKIAAGIKKQGKGVQCAGHTFNNCKGKMQQSR
jgi:hypothetical protein